MITAEEEVALAKRIKGGDRVALDRLVNAFVLWYLFPNSTKTKD